MSSVACAQSLTTPTSEVVTASSHFEVSNKQSLTVVAGHSQAHSIVDTSVDATIPATDSIRYVPYQSGALMHVQLKVKISDQLYEASSPVPEIKGTRQRRSVALRTPQLRCFPPSSHI